MFGRPSLTLKTGLAFQADFLQAFGRAVGGDQIEAEFV